ncbi:hypothetical protein O3P69_012263 [Scylla paramamosain]|uniref:Uncharacterized protein n=1 Tax=Scylla paramamosain TaxID=85552 RepID=A0AAW0TDC0_SCYPA
MEKLWVWGAVLTWAALLASVSSSPYPFPFLRKPRQVTLTLTTDRYSHYHKYSQVTLTTDRGLSQDRISEASMSGSLTGGSECLSDRYYNDDNTWKTETPSLTGDEEF